MHCQLKCICKVKFIIFFDRLKDYASRRTELNDVDEAVIVDLTDLESQLLKTQDRSLNTSLPFAHHRNVKGGF
jgi:hypothetical protein